jgi:hypothetical protein
MEEGDRRCVVRQLVHVVQCDMRLCNVIGLNIGRQAIYRQVSEEIRRIEGRREFGGSGGTEVAAGHSFPRASAVGGERETPNQVHLYPVVA